MQLLALITLHNAFQAVLSARCGRLFLSLRHHCKPSLPLILPATYYAKKRVLGICDAYKQVTMERITQFPIPALVQVIHPFLLLRASRPGLCSDLSAGESCPLRIPFDKLRAAVSPADKPGKGRRPSASRIRKGCMTCL